MREDDLQDIVKHTKILAYLAILLFFGFLWINAGSVSEFFGSVTGKVTGSVNLTVETSTSYNFTVDDINWSSGKVDSGQDYAILSTTNGTVENGNWTAVSEGFVIQNRGNVDVTLSVSFGKVAASFLGGTSPEYYFNITNNETDSCVADGGFTLGEWTDVSSGSISVCSNFTYLDPTDEVRIDFLLKIPSDSYIDSRGDTLSISVSAV